MLGRQESRFARPHLPRRLLRRLCQRRWRLPRILPSKASSNHVRAHVEHLNVLGQEPMAHGWYISIRVQHELGVRALQLFGFLICKLTFLLVEPQPTVITSSAGRTILSNWRWTRTATSTKIAPRQASTSRPPLNTTHAPRSKWHQRPLTDVS